MLVYMYFTIKVKIKSLEKRVSVTTVGSVLRRLMRDEKLWIFSHRCLIEDGSYNGEIDQILSFLYILQQNRVNKIVEKSDTKRGLEQYHRVRKCIQINWRGHEMNQPSLPEKEVN